jgi:hypothetical protein
MGVSKKILVTTGFLVFDFELSIGGRAQRKERLRILKMPAF